MGTMDKLVEDLLHKPPSSLRTELVTNALSGRYHDYRSTLAFPKVQLVLELERYGFRDLARRAKRGDYDDEPDADDHASMGKLLAENPELADLWERMKATADPVVAAGLLADHVAKTRGGSGG